MNEGRSHTPFRFRVALGLSGYRDGPSKRKQMSRTTKAQIVLAEAEAQLNAARANLEKAEMAVSEARAVVRAFHMSYEYLAKALAPKPRGKSSPAPSAAPRSSQKKDKKAESQPPIPNIADAKVNVSSASNEEKCDVCGLDATFTDHSQPSPHYHEFVGKKSKVNAA